MVTNVKEIIALEENATSKFLKFVNDVLKPFIEHIRVYHLNHKDELIDIKQIDNLEILLADYIAKEKNLSQLMVSSEGKLEIRANSEKIMQLVNGLTVHCNGLKGILELIKSKQENSGKIDELIVNADKVEGELRELFNLIHGIKV